MSPWVEMVTFYERQATLATRFLLIWRVRRIAAAPVCRSPIRSDAKLARHRPVMRDRGVLYEPLTCRCVSDHQTPISESSIRVEAFFCQCRLQNKKARPGVPSWWQKPFQQPFRSSIEPSP